MDGLKPASLGGTDALGRLDQAQLETLLAGYCRARGYAVESARTAAAGAKFDGRVDMILRRDDEFVLVQCSHWMATTVAHDAVHALLDVMADLDATGGVVVTSGAFSSAAIDAASQQGHVELLDGGTLRAMLGPGGPLYDELPLPIDADVFAEGAYAGDVPEWPTRSAGHRAPRGTGPPVTSRLLLWSLGLKLTFAFALVLLFAWAIDTAVHPLLQPLRLHRVTAAEGLPSAPVEGHVARGAQSAQQDPGDDATPDAWHQPSADEILGQQRKADGSTQVTRQRTPEM